MKKVDPDKLLRQKEIVISREHVTPEVYQAVGVIRRGRFYRKVYEGLTLGLVPVGIFFSAIAAAAAFPGIFGPRFFVANDIRKAHEEIRTAPSLLQAAAENHYPRDWIKVMEIIQTHPIFYVKGNGDLVLVKNSRSEYLKYVLQKKLGWTGANTWQWRGYLQPPVAPEPMKKWAAKKAAEIMEKVRLRRKPVPKPALIPVRVTPSRRGTILRSRRRA